MKLLHHSNSTNGVRPSGSDNNQATKLYLHIVCTCFALLKML